MAVLKKCESKDGRLDSDDDKCKDYIYYVLFLNTQRLSWLSWWLLLVWWWWWWWWWWSWSWSWSWFCNIFNIFWCSLCLFCCFFCWYFPTSTWNHWLSNPSTAEEWLRTALNALREPPLQSLFRTKIRKGKKHAVAGWPLVDLAKYGSLNNKQMWNRCELNDSFTMQQIDWVVIVQHVVHWIHV